MLAFGNNQKNDQAFQEINLLNSKDYQQKSLIQIASIIRHIPASDGEKQIKPKQTSGWRANGTNNKLRSKSNKGSCKTSIQRCANKENIGHSYQEQDIVVDYQQDPMNSTIRNHLSSVFQNKLTNYFAIQLTDSTASTKSVSGNPKQSGESKMKSPLQFTQLNHQKRKDKFIRKNQLKDAINNPGNCSSTQRSLYNYIYTKEAKLCSPSKRVTIEPILNKKEVKVISSNEPPSKESTEKTNDQVLNHQSADLKVILQATEQRTQDLEKELIVKENTILSIKKALSHAFNQDEQQSEQISQLERENSELKRQIQQLLNDITILSTHIMSIDPQYFDTANKRLEEEQAQTTEDESSDIEVRDRLAEEALQTLQHTQNDNDQLNCSDQSRVKCRSQETTLPSGALLRSTSKAKVRSAQTDKKKTLKHAVKVLGKRTNRAQQIDNHTTD